MSLASSTIASNFLSTSSFGFSVAFGAAGSSSLIVVSFSFFAGALDSSAGAFSSAFAFSCVFFFHIRVLSWQWCFWIHFCNHETNQVVI